MYIKLGEKSFSLLLTSCLDYVPDTITKEMTAPVMKNVED